VHVGVVLDRSYSMQDCRQETINGLNEYLGHLKAEAGVHYRFSLTQFDSHSIDNLYVDVPLEEVAPRTLENYVPRGGTPLFDAVGRTMHAISERVPAHQPVLFVIQTDGQENASQEWTRERLFAAIKAKETDGWTFIFLGADQNAYAQASLMGISVGNTMAYASSDTAGAYSVMAAATRCYSANIGKGMGSTAAFYQDAGVNVDARDPDKTTGVLHGVQGTTTTTSPLDAILTTTPVDEDIQEE